MAARDVTLIYEGEMSGGAIKTAIETAAKGAAVDDIKIIENQQSGTVAVIHISGA